MTDIDTIIEQQGWDDSSLLGLALSYIENQGDPEGWRDFLIQQVDLENGNDLDEEQPMLIPLDTLGSPVEERAESPGPDQTPFQERTAAERLLPELTALLEGLHSRGITARVVDGMPRRTLTWMILERDGNTGTVQYDNLNGYGVSFSIRPSRETGSALMVTEDRDLDGIEKVLDQCEKAVGSTYANFAAPHGLPNHGRDHFKMWDGRTTLLTPED